MKKHKKKRKPVRKNRIRNQKRELVQTVKEIPILVRSQGRFDAKNPVEMTEKNMPREAFQSDSRVRILDYPKIGPTLEVYSSTDVTVESLNELLSAATNRTVLMVSQEIKGIAEKFSTIFDDDPETTITFRNLTRVMLLEDETKGWLITFAYVGDLQTEHFLDIQPDPNRQKTSRELAEETIIDILADLMFKDGIDNPDGSFQQRTFLFEGVLLVVPEKMHAEFNKNRGTGAGNRLTLESANDSFQKFKDELGGEFASADVQNMAKNRMEQLFQLISDTLQLGERRWPFNRDSVG